MIERTIVTWVLVIFGVITLLPLLYAQLTILVQPHGQKAKDILIGKEEDWRDETHFRSAYGFAWADWILLIPLFVSGSIGVLLGSGWGYVLWAAAGTISLYINIVGLWRRTTSIPLAGLWPIIHTIGGFLLYGVVQHLPMQRCASPVLRSDDKIRRKRSIPNG